MKVMFAVGEIGLAHERIDRGGKFGGLDTPEFLALNPNGLVPVIEDDGFVLWESNAILRHLARKHPAARLMPDAPHPAADVDRWMEWQSESLAEPCFTIFYQRHRAPPDKRDESKVGPAVAQCARLFAMLGDRLGRHPFICGDHLTLADVCVGVMAYRWFEMAIDRPSQPTVEAWYDRLKQRDAFRRHVMVGLS
jgi:glutathione S-transferase